MENGRTVLRFVGWMIVGAGILAMTGLVNADPPDSEPVDSPVLQENLLNTQSLVTDPAPRKGLRAWTVVPRNPSLEVSSAALDPKHEILACASPRDGVIRLFEAKSGKLVSAWISPDAHVRKLVWASPTLVIAGCENGTLYWWDAKQNRLVRKVAPGQDTFLTDLAACPSADMIAAVRRGTVTLLSIKTGKTTGEIRSDGNRFINWVSFSPKGDELACGADSHEKGNVSVWGLKNPDTPVSQREMATEKHPWSISWSPDGKCLFVGLEANLHMLCDALTLAVSFKATGHEWNHAGWSPDSTTVALSCWNDTWLLSARDGRLLEVNGTCRWHGDQPAGFGWSADGSKLMYFSQGGDGFCRDLKSGKTLWTALGGAGTWGVLMVDDKTAMALNRGLGNDSVSLFDIQTGKAVAGTNCKRALFLPCGEPSGFANPQINSGQMIRDACKPLPFPQGVGGGAGDLTSFDGQTVIRMTNMDGQVHLSKWTPGAKKCKLLCKLPAPPRATAISPKGALLAVASEKTTLILSPRDGATLHDLGCPGKDCAAMCFLSEKCLVAFRGSEATTWDLEGKEPKPSVAQLPCRVFKAVVPMEGSGDTLALVTDKGVLLWDAQKQTQVAKVTESPVREICWSSKTQQMVAAEWYGVSVWDLKALKVRYRRVWTDMYRAMAVTPDGDVAFDSRALEQAVYVGLSEDGRQTIQTPVDFLAAHRTVPKP